MSNITELRPNRVEIWTGVPHGKSAGKWFVSLWEQGCETIVYDGDSEHAAAQAAKEWGLPITVLR